MTVARTLTKRSTHELKLHGKKHKLSRGQKNHKLL
jgi:hypothetical protein